jgi:hypothetical protein
MFFYLVKHDLRRNSVGIFLCMHYKNRKTFYKKSENFWPNDNGRDCSVPMSFFISTLMCDQKYFWPVIFYFFNVKMWWLKKMKITQISPSLKVFWRRHTLERKIATTKPTCNEKQGDQIGRFFAYWPIKCCGQLLKITEVALAGGAVFSSVKVMHNFWQKWVGPHFGRFHHKLIWSPWWKV